MSDDGGGYCSNCASLEARCARLEAELAAARREIERLRDRQGAGRNVWGPSW